MPYSIEDVDKHKKGLSDHDKEIWIGVANSVLAKCIEDGGEEATCAAKAIQQASGVLKKREAETMPDETNELTEAMKTVGGKQYPAGDFLVVEDSESPDTWHLQVKRNGEPDHGLMGAAFAALTVGYRGNKYEGPDKAKALAKLKALYSSEEMDLPNAEAEPLGEVGKRLSAAQVKKLREAQAVITEILRWAAYEDGEPEPEPEEEEDMEAAEIELAESAIGHVISLAEQLPLPGSEKIVPLHLDVALITPGWGNKRDNHYYPRDVVERDSGVFAGVKMYETDHRQDEKSTRTWVSTVKEIAGYTDDGAPIGRVSVHDRNFAERLMALAADNLLEKMECSILAAGTARKGEVDGKKGHIVEAITSAESVDWVTRAGAGGRALSLAESNVGGESMDEERTDAIEEQETEPTEEPLEEVTLQEQQEPEEQPPAPAKLEPEKVSEMVEATNLPDAAKARLCEREYADRAELEGAIGGEVAYIKEVTGSGKPFAQGAGSAPEKRPRTAEEADADWKRILAEVGMPHLGGN